MQSVLYVLYHVLKNVTVRKYPVINYPVVASPVEIIVPTEM